MDIILISIIEFRIFGSKFIILYSSAYESLEREYSNSWMKNMSSHRQSRLTVVINRRHWKMIS